MAPLLISYGQGIVDEYRKEMLVEEYLRERGHPIGSVTDRPAILAQDDAEVNLIPRSPTLRPISLWTSPIMAYPSSTCTGLAFRWDYPPSCRGVGLPLNRRLLLL